MLLSVLSAARLQFAQFFPRRAANWRLLVIAVNWLEPHIPAFEFFGNIGNLYYPAGLMTDANLHQQIDRIGDHLVGFMCSHPCISTHYGSQTACRFTGAVRMEGAGAAVA